jgi:transcriptional antiterminator NusG
MPLSAFVKRIGRTKADQHPRAEIMAEETPNTPPQTLTATPDAADALNAPEDLHVTKGAEELVSLTEESPAPVAEASDEPSPDVPEPAEVTEESVEEVEEVEEPDEGADEPPPVENKKKWYAVKVQSNREDTIKEAIERRVKKEGLEEFYGQIVIPVEKYTEVKQDKNGRKVTRTKERKLYPGYLFVEVEYNDRILYLFRETSGVGDFVGSHPNKLERAPTPMSETEVLRIIGKPATKDEPTVPQPPPGLGVGDRVKVVDGTFNGMEGMVKKILEATGKVEVEVSIFGRPVNVELDYYQVEEI